MFYIWDVFWAANHNLYLRRALHHKLEPFSFRQSVEWHLFSYLIILKGAVHLCLDLEGHEVQVCTDVWWICCNSPNTKLCESPCVHAPTHASRILHNLPLNFCHLQLQNNQHIEVKWGSERKTCCFHSQVQPQSSLHIVMHSLLAWLSMLKQMLSRGLFSYRPRSSNEVTPYRILGMSRMARFKTFLERCICYQIEDGWLAKKVKMWSAFAPEAQHAAFFKLTGLAPTRIHNWKYDSDIIM